MSTIINEAELRRLDLNLLLVFSAVMRTGSVKAASEQLYLGPSAVSMALARLRHVVGDPLFIRGKTGLRPTSAAEAFYERLAPALASIAGAVAESTRFDPGDSDRTFHIGMTDDLEWWLLPPVRRVILQEAPDVRIVARTVEFQNGLDLLDTGRLDLVITAHPRIRGSTMHSCSVITEDFIVLAAPGTALPDPLTMTDYLAFPHALVSASGSAWGIIDAELERHGAHRRVTTTVSNVLTLPHLLDVAGPIATMPRGPGSRLSATFGLQMRELPFASPTVEIGMIWHGRSQKAAGASWLRDQIAAAIAPGIGAG